MADSKESKKNSSMSWSHHLLMVSSNCNTDLARKRGEYQCKKMALKIPRQVAVSDQSDIEMIRNLCLLDCSVAQWDSGFNLQHYKKGDEICLLTSHENHTMTLSWLFSIVNLINLGKWNLSWGIFSFKLACRHVCVAFCLLSNVEGPSGVTPGQMVLCCIRKGADHGARGANSMFLLLC